VKDLWFGGFYHDLKVGGGGRDKIGPDIAQLELEALLYFAPPTSPAEVLRL
jgi:hypothetical protein